MACMADDPSPEIRPDDLNTCFLHSELMEEYGGRVFKSLPIEYLSKSQLRYAMQSWMNATLGHQ